MRVSITECSFMSGHLGKKSERSIFQISISEFHLIQQGLQISSFDRSNPEFSDHCHQYVVLPRVSQRMSSEDSCMSADFLANTSHITE